MVQKPVPKDIATPFLGVESSLTGRRWVGPSGDDIRLAEAMEQTANLAYPWPRSGRTRGRCPRMPALPGTCPARSAARPDDTARHGAWPPTASMAAVETRERIAIFADYDVDGGRSAALLARLVAPTGSRCHALCSRPYRRRLRARTHPRWQTWPQRHDLIVCVDCGTLSALKRLPRPRAPMS